MKPPPRSAPGGRGDRHRSSRRSFIQKPLTADRRTGGTPGLSTKVHDLLVAGVLSDRELVVFDRLHRAVAEFLVERGRRPQSADSGDLTACEPARSGSPAWRSVAAGARSGRPGRGSGGAQAGKIRGLPVAAAPQEPPAPSPIGAHFDMPGRQFVDSASAPNSATGRGSAGSRQRSRTPAARPISPT